MLNDESAYTSAGAKSATAMNEDDWSRAQFHRNWFFRARALERGDDRRRAENLFKDAFSRARRVR